MYRDENEQVNDKLNQSENLYENQGGYEAQRGFEAQGMNGENNSDSNESHTYNDASFTSYQQQDNYTGYTNPQYTNAVYDEVQGKYYDAGVNHGDNKSGKKPKGKKSFGKTLMKTTAIALVFGLVAGGCYQGVNYMASKWSDNKSKSEVTVAEEENSLGNTTEQGTTNGVLQNTGNNPVGIQVNDVSGVVENVMPAIVSISSTVTSSTMDIFGREYEESSVGSGSGIIIGQNKEEVLIVTNNHVIAGAKEVAITFDDESVAKAAIKGTDKSADLAVVAVKLSDLSTETKGKIKIATLGSSEDLKTGELAIAIGNALGYGQSVTVGYISALNRQVAVEDNTMTLLQTDAAINPGNSGGALLNARGEVIGINSVKYASSTVEGMGYAIPISDAIPIINDLMNREAIPEAEQAYLGILGQDVTQAYAQRFNMPMGVYVNGVSDGSPAQKAGIKEGDIIVKFNGKDINGMAQLQDCLSNTRAGKQVQIVVKYQNRGQYKEKPLTVTLGNKGQMQQ